MKHVVFCVILFASIATVVLAAEDKKNDALNSLSGKVQKLTTTRKNMPSSAVAGVKGTKNDRIDIYWKGKEKTVEVSDDELQKLNAAMELQRNGDKIKALKQYEAFIKEFPGSALHAEVTQTVQSLKKEIDHQPSLPSAQPDH